MDSTIFKTSLTQFIRFLTALLFAIKPFYPNYPMQNISKVCICPLLYDFLTVNSNYKFALFPIPIPFRLNNIWLVKVSFFKDVIFHTKFSMLHYRFVLRLADWAGDDLIVNYSLFAEGVATFCTLYNYFYSSTKIFNSYGFSQSN